jgi:hypothetical protein
MVTSYVSKWISPRKSKFLIHLFMFRLILSRIHDLEIQSLYSNPIQFYDFLQNRVMIIFRPKSEADYDGPEFSLVLSKKQTYDTVLVPYYPNEGQLSSSA